MRVIIRVGIEWFSVECGFLHHPRRCNAVKDAALCRRWTRLCWCRTGDDCEALRLAAKTACKNNQHSSWCAQKTHTHRHISTLTTYSRQSSSLRPFIFHNEVRCIRCMTNTARTFAWRVESSATDAYFFFCFFPVLNVVVGSRWCFLSSGWKRCSYSSRGCRRLWGVHFVSVRTYLRFAGLRVIGVAGHSFVRAWISDTRSGGSAFCLCWCACVWRR